MTKRQEEAERRREIKASRAAYEKMCRKIDAEQFRKIQGVKTEALRAEQSVDCLLLLGEIWDEKIHKKRDAATFAEEKESCLMFAAALGIENPALDSTTLRDLIRRVFYEWNRQGAPPLNPYTKRLSTDWILSDEAKAKNEHAVFDGAWSFSGTHISV